MGVGSGAWSMGRGGADGRGAGRRGDGRVECVRFLGKDSSNAG
jgi:hypothetical protein